MVSFKSDGIRMVLFANKNRTLCWVDRNGTFTTVGGSAVDNVYMGTVLDGELIDKKFVVFDCVAITGTPVHHKSLPHRLMHATAACRLIKLDQFELCVKTTVCASNLDRLLKLNSDKSDGLIFTPSMLPVEVRGTARETLKWKHQSSHTVDLWLLASNQNLQYILCTEDSHVVNDNVMFEEDDPLGMILEKRLVECRWVNKNFYPIVQNGLLKIRHDKPRANSAYVVERTIRAITDNITIEELLEMRYIRN